MQPGLEGVVAAETVLSTADPKRGMLWLRGVPVPKLVAEYGYEGTIALLWDGFGVRHAAGVAGGGGAPADGCGGAALPGRAGR